MKDESPGEAVLCIPGMSLLCHLGHFWGLVVALSAKLGALCTPPGGRLLGGVPLGPTVLRWVGPGSNVAGYHRWLRRMAWPGWHGKGVVVRMAWPGWHSAGGAVRAACTQQLSVLLPAPARPQPLPHGTDGFNTFLGFFFFL